MRDSEEISERKISLGNIRLWLVIFRALRRRGAFCIDSGEVLFAGFNERDAQEILRGLMFFSLRSEEIPRG